MYNIFISHAWKYNSEYYNLEEMLNNAPYFTWKNYSVPQHDALDTKTNKSLLMCVDYSWNVLQL